MQVIDIIILVLVLAGIVVGFRKGFIKQLASLVGLVSRLAGSQGALYGVVGDNLIGHGYHPMHLCSYHWHSS